MSKTRQKKEAAVVELQQQLATAQAIFLTDYRGLNVKEMLHLRRQLGQARVDFKVVKNTLTQRAVAALGWESLFPYLTGPTAVAVARGDEVAPARLLIDFAKEHKALEIKGGLLHGQVLSAEGVKELAELPPREVLLGRVLGGMQAPLAGFAGALQGLFHNLVYVLDAIRRQQEGEAV